MTIRVTITAWEACRRELWLAGRLVAYRRRWNLPVQLGRDVTVVRGGFPRRCEFPPYPTLSGAGTVLEVRNVPRAAVPDQQNVEIIEPFVTSSPE